MSADALLKAATEKKDLGDLTAAINLLREAYRQISFGSTIYPVSTFLRLPLYLQQAGRADEAWREFNLLLAGGYPNQLSDLEVLPMEHSNVYAKMRLFLQREKKFDLAVRFGILSYMSWAVGLHRQKRKAELRSYIGRRNIDETVVALVKKAKVPELKGEVVALLLAEIEHLPNVDMSELGGKVDRIVLR